VEIRVPVEFPLIVPTPALLLLITVAWNPFLIDVPPIFTPIVYVLPGVYSVAVDAVALSTIVNAMSPPKFADPPWHEEQAPEEPGAPVLSPPGPLALLRFKITNIAPATMVEVVFM
jgi:hypothetical protein